MIEIKDGKAILKDAYGREYEAGEVRKGTLKASTIPVELNNGILKDSEGNEYLVKGAVDLLVTPKEKKAVIVLKGTNTEGGAESALKLIKHRFPEAKIVTKSYYDEGCDVYSLPDVPSKAPMQVVVEQTLEPVVEAVKSKDVEDLVSAMLKKGLLDIDSMGVFISQKFHEMLHTFSEQKFRDMLDMHKSVEADTAQEGVVYLIDFKKSGDVAPKLAGTQEEVDQKEGTIQSVSDDSTGPDSRSEAPKGDPAPDMAPSQDEVDVKTDQAEAVSVPVFKSLRDSQAWLKKNPGYEIVATNREDRLTYGGKFHFKAVTPKQLRQ